MIYTLAIALAQEAPKAVPAPPSDPGFMAFLPFVLMFVIFWFLLIRPQQKKMKEQLDMQSNLQRGEEVVTASGIIGKITGVAERVVTLEIADNVRVKFLRSQISTVVKGDQQLS
jgi:preprotein translocase subunit YajC